MAELWHFEPVVDARPPRCIDLRDLLNDARQAIVLHEEHRLRITSNAKLILTK